MLEMFSKKFLNGWLSPQHGLPDATLPFGAGIWDYVKYFLMNYADNFLFAFVTRSNTLALIFAIYLSITSGQPVGFASTSGGASITWW